MKYQEFKQSYQINLDRQQETAVQAVEGAVLLLAVPGSGKTTVLVSRLGYMIFCKNILPEAILTITYTVAATKDMRKRFETLFGREYGERLEFRTINGISHMILQYFGRITQKDLFPVAVKEASGIVKNVYRSVTGGFATENDIKNVQTAITYVKNMRLNQEEIDNLQLDMDRFPEIYAEYNKELKRQSLMDFDDQMVYALRILEQFPEVCLHFQERYQYICVDEAQDTSRIQHDMINLLVKKTGNLFMVGDEDQCIYGFRAAYPEALVSFENDHQGAKVLLQESNYRSNQEIVAAADQLIQANKQRHEKHMKAIRPGGGQVTQIQAKSREEQYYYLARVAKDCDRVTAVLYRNNESALPLIDIMERNGISYRMKKSDMTYFSHPIVNDICDFIRLAADPCDKEAFFRIYYKMGAGISKAAAMSAAENSQGKKSLLDEIEELDGISAYTRKQCRLLSIHFHDMASETAGRAICRILHCMGYQEYIDDHGMDSGKATILQILGDQEANPADFPGRLDYLKDIIANGCGDHKSRFILSTIHSSKGLEYDRVYMADMLSGILPSCQEPKGRNPDQADIDAYEEERRLFYVGMTRARNELYIFTFQEGETSSFSKAVFGTDRKERVKPEQKKESIHTTFSYAPYQSKKNGNPPDMEKALSDYEMGILVWHKKYGRGVVVERDGDFADILFDSRKETKKIALTIAISNGILSVHR